MYLHIKIYQNFYCATNWRFCEVKSQRKFTMLVSSNVIWKSTGC